MATIDFTETFALAFDFDELSGTWTELDLTSLGVPANAVVCMLLLNVSQGAVTTIGVRKIGSSLERKVLLHEAEGGGSTSCVMHVQVDANKKIEYVVDDSVQNGYLGSGYVLGYYGSGITYTEEMTEHASVTVAGWRSTAVDQNDTVFEFCCQNDGGDKNTATNVGTREVGSSLARYYDIHEAEPSGVNSYTSYVQSDASGNVELYRGDTYGNFFRLGYFSSNIQLEEAFDACTPTSDATWRTDISINTGGENCVGLIACMHQSNGTQENTGARGGASSAARYWLEHESESDQYTGDTLPVLVDSSGYYDTYFGDVSDGYFYCLGYLYDTGGAPVGWSAGDVDGVAAADIAKIMGVAVADITSVTGVE